jgi:hypothetical protein
VRTASADVWDRARTASADAWDRVWTLRVHEAAGAKLQIGGPHPDGRRIASSHCGQNTCLGTNRCDIGHRPERAPIGTSAGMGQVHAATEGAHAAIGVGGYK